MERRPEVNLFRQVEEKVMRIASTCDSITLMVLISATAKLLNKLIDMFWIKVREEARQLKGRRREK